MPTRRDLEEGLRPTLALLAQEAEAADALASKVDALERALAERGIIVEAVQVEAPAPPRGDVAFPIIRRKIPPEVMARQPDVDCMALLHLCHGRCCHMTFPLDAEEVEAGHARWDVRQPYLIAQGDNARCVHQEGPGRCGIYEDRPAPCRLYDCRQDRRIWIDFDRKIPAPFDDPDDPIGRMPLTLRWPIRRKGQP